MKKKVEEKREYLLNQGSGYIAFAASLEKIKSMVDGEVTAKAINDLDIKDAELQPIAGKIASIMTKEGLSFAEIEEEISGAANYFNSQLEHHYNVDFNPRAEIVGDNYADSYEKGYGNNDVKGPDA